MWWRLVSTALGVWLMASPAVLGYGDPAATNAHVVGPLVVSFAFVAIWEVVRGLRLVNAPLGAWLVVAPWALGYESSSATWNSVVVGLVVAFVATRGGEVRGRFGGGWSSLLGPADTTTGR